jgi:Spy/CpxP family protein refolding chaperone
MNMKKLIPFMLIAFLLGTTITLNAQTKEESKDASASSCHKDGKCVAGIPDLTDQQKQKIEDLCLAHKKETTQIKNQLNEKQAHLKTLQGADKADMAAINKTIDEIGVFKADLMKKCAATKQSIKELLNDKQKIAFDSKPMNCCGSGNGGAKENCHKSEKANCSGHSGSQGCGKSCEKKCQH